MKILSAEESTNKDKIYHIQIPPAQQIVFGYILESLEGWVYYTTIDVENSIIWVEIIQDYIEEFDLLFTRLLKFLKYNNDGN